MKIRLTSALATVVAAVTVAACTSSTSGTGAVSGSPAGGGSGPATGSSGDFPSTSSSGSGSGGSSGSPTAGTPSPGGSSGPPATPITTKTVHAPNREYVVAIWAQEKDRTCADHAYGKAMIDFLKQHPCQGLRRILATTTINGRPVGLAESATSFGSSGGDPYKIVGEFTQLEQSNGTGSINDLMREGHRLPKGPAQIPTDEVFKVLSQDNVATVWDAWYLDGPTSAKDPALNKMIEDVFLLL